MTPIATLAQQRLDTEVEPILADYKRGLERYTEALDIIASIHKDIDAAGRWYNPFSMLDQTKAYRLITRKAKFIDDVCLEITARLSGCAYQ